MRLTCEAAFSGSSSPLTVNTHTSLERRRVFGGGEEEARGRWWGGAVEERWNDGSVEEPSAGCPPFPPSCPHFLQQTHTHTQFSIFVFLDVSIPSSSSPPSPPLLLPPPPLLLSSCPPPPPSSLSSPPVLLLLRSVCSTAPWRRLSWSSRQPGQRIRPGPVTCGSPWARLCLDWAWRGCPRPCSPSGRRAGGTSREGTGLLETSRISFLSPCLI